MDNQFDNLMNKKCSWSYRSQKTTHKHNMEADTNSFSVQSTFLSEALKNKSNVESEKSFKGSKNKHLSVSHQTDLEKNTVSASPENEQSDSSEVKEKTNMLTSEVSDKESESENMKISPEENIKLPRSSVKTSDANNDQTSVYDKAESYNPSSDEEVFQTRFTIENKAFIHQDEHISKNFSPSSDENARDRTSEINLETDNMFPIIIQTKVYDENKKIIYPNNEINAEMKQEISNQQDKTDIFANSLSVETDNSNIEVESSNMKNSMEDNGLIECDNKKNRNEISEDAKGTTESGYSLAKNVEKSNNELVDLVIQEFLNGSFDITTYKPERSSMNIMEESIISRKQSVNSKLPTNKGNVIENNKKTLELFMATKKTKLNNLNNSMNKDDWLGNSHCTSTIGLKRKHSERQTEDSKKAKIMRSTYVTKKMLITEGANDNSKSSCNLDDKYLKAKKQKKKVNRSSNSEKNTNVLNNFDSKEKSSEKIKTKHNTIRTKNYKKKVSDQFSYDSPIKKGSRNKRNSSLIASQKIKNIGRVENYESSEEIWLESDNSNTNLSTKQTENKNAKTNYTLKNKNEFKTDKICIQNKAKISSEGTQSYLARIKNLEKRRITRSRHKTFKDIFDAYDFIIENPLKKIDGEVTNKYFTSGNDSSDNYFMLENEYKNENFNSGEKETLKKENQMIEISDVNDMSNEFTSFKCNSKNLIPFKNSVTRCKRKTWDMLEKELLGELNDAQFTNNINETVILKEENLVRKSNIKNSNLYTVSNRSITQTVSKSGEKNRYNMEYKIENTDGKYLETKTNEVYSYPREFDRTQQKKVSNKAKNAVVEKTIAAMERCTAEFIKPKLDIEPEKEIDELQFTDIFDGLDVNETEFHTNTTFMANENEHYFKNEIVSVLKKFTTREKNSKSNKKSNTYTVKNCHDAEKEFEYSNHNENLDDNFSTTNCIFNENTQKKNMNKNWALVSLQEKQTNSWEKLMKELNLGEDTDKGMHKKGTFKKLLQKPYGTKKNLNKKKNCKQNRIIKNMKNEVSKQTINKEEIVQSHTLVSGNSSAATNKKTTEDIFGSTRNFDKMSKLNNESLTTKIEKPIKKVPRNTKVDKIQKVKSPKFKLQLEKNGGLKFKRDASRSSSRSSSLEKFEVPKPNIKQMNERSNDKANKEKKKYKKYVEKLLSTENILTKNNVSEDDKTGFIKMQNINNEDFEGSKDQNKKNLISQNEEDFFSLSSSDSEMDNEKNQGSGLLFDLFEE